MHLHTKGNLKNIPSTCSNLEVRMTIASSRKFCVISEIGGGEAYADNLADAVDQLLIRNNF